MEDTETSSTSTSTSSAGAGASRVGKVESFFTTEEFDDALALMDSQPQQSAKVFASILAQVDGNEESTAKTSRMKEEAIYMLGKIFAKANDVPRVKQLMVDIRPFFATISKPRSAKIVRSLIDEISHMPNSAAFLVEVCLDAIDWCTKEKRSFLRQRIQARLSSLYLSLARYKEALAVIKKLVKEVKKFDDKPLMVEICLVESKVYFALQNVPKSKASLTTARANANSFYCPPLLQAQIDIQAGILCAAERDFKTAFSYFYESFEGFCTSNDTEEATRSLKYMLLSKIMSNQASDVYPIINSKAGLRFAGQDVEAMRAVANACTARSIHQLGDVLNTYKVQLADDAIIQSHVGQLLDNLLEANLKRIVEPYSRVQVSHVAKLINLPRDDVESKLSQLILDKKLRGILDQGTDDLLLFEDRPEDPAFKTSLLLVKELEACVDRLQNKTRRLASS